MQRKQVKDRRVQRTEALLRDALITLIREKAYDSIVVKEILDRANVGRTAFYTHFRDKDELLASSIHQILRSTRPTKLPSARAPYEKILRFSLPIFEYLHEHRQQNRHSNGGGLDTRSRAILHEHLQTVLVELVRDDVELALKRTRNTATQIPPEVLVHYVASTFVLVLNWWVETDSPLTPQEPDQVFRALVLPTLVTVLNV